MNGVPPQAIRNVWGVAKIYETYVGAKEFQPKGKIFDQIQEVGQEYGATTGRKRQVNWMNLNFLKKSININGVTHLVFNKVDVLEEINNFALYEFNQKREFESMKDMENFVDHRVHKKSHYLKEIHFSRTPHAI